MKRFILTGILLLLVISITPGCNENKKVKNESLSLNEPKAVVPPENTRTVAIDVAKSTVEWRGTKLGGIRGHEGTLNFEQGDLYLKGDSVVGGYFIVNMESLKVTDIPEEQAKAKNNLTKHLKSEFKTNEYPRSTFQIRTVTNTFPKELQVLGDLSIIGTTKSVQLPLKPAPTSGPGNLITADLWLNRSDWNIGEDGSWLEKRVVDNEFRLKVSIVY